LYISLANAYISKRGILLQTKMKTRKKVDESMGAPEGDKLVPSSSLAMGVSHFDSCGFIAFLILVFFPISHSFVPNRA
jgi:hypothetical protein